MDALQARVAGLRERSLAREAGERERGIALLARAKQEDPAFARWLEGFRGTGRLTYVRCGDESYGKQSPPGMQASHSGDAHVGVTRKRSRA